MLTRLYMLLIAAVMVLAIVACSEDPTPTPAPVPAPTPTAAGAPFEPLNVVASIYPMQYFAERIGGDRVEVVSLVPPGAEGHTFELTARDLLTIGKADVIAMNGLELEPWLDRALESLGNDVSAVVVEAADAEAALPFVEGGHEDEHGHMEEGEDEHDDHDEMIAGRLLVADGVEAHLSVIDLTTDDVDSGIFGVAAPQATVKASPTHRYGIVLASGPEDGDDRIHVFDSGVFYVPHGDHYDLVTQPVSRHALEIVEETPVHTVNNHGWTAIFADTSGHVILINEQDLVSSTGDYEPIVLEAGKQHGAALVISEGHVAVTIPHPEHLENPDFWNILPEGVQVRTFDNELVFDAGACHRTHGVSHNAHGAVFGCWDGTFFLHVHDGEYESEIIPYPPEAGELGEFAIGQYFGHHGSDNFFGPATLFPNGQCCDQGGIWLVDVVNSEMREVFPEPIASAAFSSDGETFYMLAADGVLRAFDAHDGELIESMQLVDPFEMVFGSPSPAMIVVGEWLYVADPNSGHVLGVHLEEMEIEEEWEIGGAPSSLAFLGVTDSSGAPDADHEEHGHEDEDEHGHDGHDHGEFDPHFWLDPLRAVTQAERIAEALIEADPEGADVYRANLATLSSDLRALHAEFEAGLISCVHREFVTSHAAYGYLALAYDLEQVSVAGLSPEAEPTPQRLAAIADRIDDLGLGAVLVEPVLAGSHEQVLASETGASVYQIHPMDGITQAELDEHGDYFGLMRDNLKSLRIAMECS